LREPDLFGESFLLADAGEPQEEHVRLPPAVRGQASGGRVDPIGLLEQQALPGRAAPLATRRTRATWSTAATARSAYAGGRTHEGAHR
jgi:hypothetical protein